MAIHKVFDKETGEIKQNITYDFRSEEFKEIEYIPMNTIFNVFDEGKFEIVYYKKSFIIPKYVALDEDLIFDKFTDKNAAVKSSLSIENSKMNLNDILGVIEGKIEKNFGVVDNIVYPIKENVAIADLQKSINTGGRRAKENFYSYALSNNWEYFCTYTFEDKETRDDKLILGSCWTNFIRSIKCRSPDLKAIAVPEKFKKGGFHLHSLMANCDLTLKPKRHDKTKEFLFSDFGHPRMNCLDWKNGFNEVVMINPESSQLQVVNYLTKYFTKAFDVPFHAKRYFRTNNLDCKTKYLDDFRLPELLKTVANLKMVQYKDTDNITVYRNF